MILIPTSIFVALSRVELHFFDGEQGLVHAEVQASEPRAFHSARLGLASDELVWPIDLDEVAVAARARGVPARSETDVLRRPQLIIGYAALTDAGDTLVVSVARTPTVD